MAKQYRSKAAQEMAKQRKAKPMPRQSKQFSGGSNPHHGASRSNSGQQPRKK
jgi:hypothetical protein